MIRVAFCALHGRSGHEAGRDLLRLLYREETGQQELPPVHVTPRGKPYLPDHDLHFSISHTREHAVCVMAHVPVGIDAEELNRPLRLKTAEKILSAGELQQFYAADDPRRAFLTFWVLKEAAAKLSGLGLQGFPNETDFLLDDPHVREWDGCLIALMTQGSEEGEVLYVV